MNIKKKIGGFTLIELLATVIILAIVLLIAVPQILNIINKTRKSAFAADAIVAGKDALSALNETYLYNNSRLPVEGKSISIDIETLLNEDLSEYTGQVIIERNEGKLIPYITITNNTYYICNTYIEDIKASIVTTDSECILPISKEENKPLLIDGMTPIIWDENGNVIPTTEADPAWYSYTEEEKKWANVVTEDGSMWVWIPRYAYQITEGFHTNTAGTIDVKFLKGTSDIAFDGSNAAPVNQGNNPGSDKMFVTHPAFKFGDDELEGIWIMKFEANSNNGKIGSIPNGKAIGGWVMNAIFSSARAMEKNAIYGWGTSGDGIDTHMLKDVEWGAAAYLSWSKFGKNSEVWINNSNVYTSGCAGTSVSTTVYGSCDFEYNTQIGKNASTTGNYHGIYDMSGGANENTAGVLVGGQSTYIANGSSLISVNPKYVDRYVGNSTDKQTNYDSNKDYYGNAKFEISSRGSGAGDSWNSDSSNFMATSCPFSRFGARYNGGVNAGIFSYSCQSGSGTPQNSWRGAIAVKQGL